MSRIMRQLLLALAAVRPGAASAKTVAPSDKRARPPICQSF